MAFSRKQHLFLCVCATVFLFWAGSPQHKAARSPHHPSAASPNLLARDISGLDNGTRANITKIDGITYYNGTSYWAVTCVYSISGAYTRFQRILFYIVLLTTFLVRFHEWLTAAGVAYLLSYSSTAAIHAFPLSLQHHVGTDLDHEAIIAILAPSIVSGIVFALYSPRFLDTDPTNLYGAWTILVTLSLTMLSLNNPRYMVGYGKNAAMVACDLYNNCNDTCQAGTDGALFRSSYDQMVPYYLGPWIVTLSNTNSNSNATITRLDTSFLDIGSSYMQLAASAYWTSLMRFFFLGAVLTTQLQVLHEPPKAGRNWIFRLLASKRTTALCGWSNQRLITAQVLLGFYYVWRFVTFIIPPLLFLDTIIYLIIVALDKEDSLQFIFQYTGIRSARSISKLRILFAETLSLGWYFWAWAGYLVWPSIFIYKVVHLEKVLDGLPESERSQAVGQWGPWLGVGLAFIVACLNKFLGPTLATEKTIIYLNSTNEVDLETQSQKYSFMKWALFSLLSDESRELRMWWNNPFEVSWAEEPLDKIAAVEKAEEAKKSQEEHRLLSWVANDAEDIDYELLLSRTSKQKEDQMQQSWLSPLSKRDRDSGSVGQGSTNSSILWSCNNQYDEEAKGGEQELEDVTKISPFET